MLIIHEDRTSCGEDLAKHVQTEITEIPPVPESIIASSLSPKQTKNVLQALLWPLSTSSVHCLAHLGENVP